MEENHMQISNINDWEQWTPDFFLDALEAATTDGDSVKYGNGQCLNELRNILMGDQYPESIRQRIAYNDDIRQKIIKKFVKGQPTSESRKSLNFAFQSTLEKMKLLGRSQKRCNTKFLWIHDSLKEQGKEYSSWEDFENHIEEIIKRKDGPIEVYRSNKSQDYTASNNLSGRYRSPYPNNKHDERKDNRYYNEDRKSQYNSTEDRSDQKQSGDRKRQRDYSNERSIIANTDHIDRSNHRSDYERSSRKSTSAGDPPQMCTGCGRKGHIPQNCWFRHSKYFNSDPEKQWQDTKMAKDLSEKLETQVFQIPKYFNDKNQKDKKEQNSTDKHKSYADSGERHRNKDTDSNPTERGRSNSRERNSKDLTDKRQYRSGSPHPSKKERKGTEEYRVIEPDKYISTILEDKSGKESVNSSQKNHVRFSLHDCQNELRHLIPMNLYVYDPTFTITTLPVTTLTVNVLIDTGSLQSDFINRETAEWLDGQGLRRQCCDELICSGIGNKLCVKCEGIYDVLLRIFNEDVNCYELIKITAKIIDSPLHIILGLQSIRKYKLVEKYNSFFVEIGNERKPPVSMFHHKHRSRTAAKFDPNHCELTSWLTAVAPFKQKENNVLTKDELLTPVTDDNGILDDEICPPWEGDTNTSTANKQNGIFPKIATEERSKNFVEKLQQLCAKYSSCLLYTSPSPRDS